MHLVANKLLVEAYLDTGQIQRSRDRLDLYALLAGSDPDIDRLEHEVSQSEQGVPRAPVVAQEVVAQEAAPQETAPQEEPPAADVTPAAPVVPAQSAAGDIAAAPSGAMSGVAVRNPGQTSVPREPATGPVFPGAGQLGGEALGLQQLAPAGVVERPKHGFFGGTAEDPFAALLGDNGGSVGGGEGSVLPTSDGTQETGVLFALGSGAVGAGVTVVASALAASEPTAVSDPGSLEVPDVEPTPPAAAFDGFESGTNVQTDSEAAPATVTLGRLYLAQGHAKRAEDVFVRVLEREPNNAEARAGLAEARSDGDRRLTAAMLLGEQSDSLGSRDKKKALLTRYLDRIRASETRLSGLSTE